ncbi:MAG: hypothetical protein NC321_09340 [Clostridium sp.]|nr:hypothetical protein [Clostridium sp.]
MKREEVSYITKRLTANEGKTAISEADVLKHFGITDADLEEVEEPEIE